MWQNKSFQPILINVQEITADSRCNEHASCSKELKCGAIDWQDGKTSVDKVDSQEDCLRFDVVLQSNIDEPIYKDGSHDEVDFLLINHEVRPRHEVSP